MSYNIRRTENEVFDSFRIKGCDVIRFRDTIELPQDHFLDDFPEDHEIVAAGVDEYLPISSVRWREVWSGNSQQDLLTRILPCTLGSAEFIFVWEDGAREGFRVHDGVVTRCAVVTTLAPAEVAEPERDPRTDPRPGDALAWRYKEANGEALNDVVGIVTQPDDGSPWVGEIRITGWSSLHGGFESAFSLKEWTNWSLVVGGVDGVSILRRAK